MTKRTISVNVKPFVSLPSLLTVLFVYLKLTNQVDWSWLWVLAPTWIPFAMVFGFLGLFLGFAALCAILAAVFNK